MQREKAKSVCMADELIPETSWDKVVITCPCFSSGQSRTLTLMSLSDSVMSICDSITSPFQVRGLQLRSQNFKPRVCLSYNSHVKTI